MVIPARLRCEALPNPLAILGPRPLLSWIVESVDRAQKQSAYQILAATCREALIEGHGDLWDTGKVISRDTLNTEYRGEPLSVGKRCWWTVRTWDSRDRVSPWSAPSMFGMGPADTEWRGDWIGYNQTRELVLPPAPFEGAKWIWLSQNGSGTPDSGDRVFVGTLELPSEVEILQAEFAVTADDRCNVFFRGEQFCLSDDGNESWRKPIIRSFTERLGPGRNRFVMRVHKEGRGPAGLLFKLTVKTEDGRSWTLVSDENWRATACLAENWQQDPQIERWAKCQVVANYGDGPWGIINGVNNFLPRAAYLRTEFEIRKPVAYATLFAAALGWYDLHLNGLRGNNTYFDSGATDYSKRVYYRGYDVSESIRLGKNTWGVVLADGWYSGYVSWFHMRDLYGKHPRFAGCLYVRYSDGTFDMFHTDASWKAALGPIESADILMGETYDARREMPGWTETGFDVSNWFPVDLGVEVKPAVQPHPGPPVVALTNEEFTPRSINEPVPGVWVFDLGQNFAGIARLKVREKAGTRVTLRFAERLRGDGTLYRKNLRTAEATDVYICRGEDEEIWEPRFTYHGFQYVEVTGLTFPPSAETITGVPLSSDTPVVGSFESSDAMANKLASNIYWSQRSNFVDIPTDCPQRDERMGWTFDAQIFLQSAALRADVQAFFTKWMIDLDDAQDADGLYPWVAPRVLRAREGGEFWNGCSPGWMDAGVICPWLIYEIYGDSRQLALHYPNMVKLVEWYRKSSRRSLLPPETYTCLGDWLNQDADTPKDVIRTAYFALVSGLVAKAAEALGKDGDARQFRELQQAIKTVFNEAYIGEDGRIAGDTQTSYALALMFDLVDGARALKAGEHLVENIRRRGWRLSTGFIGTQPLMRALARVGRNDVAYRLFHNDKFPSWNFSIKNGATSIWERWDGWTPETGFGDPAMNSFNHYSFGAVYQWMVESIGGIQQAEIAYGKVLIAPTPGGRLTSARVRYDSVRGLFETRWALHGSRMELDIIIPANTRATAVLPARTIDSVREGGKALDENSEITIEQGERKDRVYIGIDSGHYRFEIEDPVLAGSETDPAIGRRE